MKLLLLFGLLLASPFVWSAEFFGEKWPEAPAAISLSEAVTKHATQQQARIKIEGRIAKVCRKKGCWMVMTDQQHSVRVKFKDYGFFVPTDILSARAEVYGTLALTQISEQRAKHLAEDGGENSGAIKGAQNEYQFVASAVKLSR